MQPVKLDEHLHPDPEIKFKSIDIEQDSNDLVVADISASPKNDIPMHPNSNVNNKTQSKLSKISSSITTKIRSKKMKKGGFEQIKDDEMEFSDKDDLTTKPDDIPEDDKSYFNINVGKNKCHCTKQQTVCIITFVILLFIAVFIGFVVIAFEHSSSHSNTANCMNGRKLLIISLDGFRAEYLDRIDTPNIDKYFIDEGVHIKHMKPVYPSKTFPNHYSIVTGLYPPSHGIVANKFWDPTLKLSFDIHEQGNDSTGNFFVGEPIWNTAKQGNINSAGLQYPGTAANCGGRTVIVNGEDMDLSGYPKYYRPIYNFSWSFNERVNVAVDLLSSTDIIYDLVLLYFEQPDSSGHQYGPQSDEVIDVVKEMDGYIGQLIEKLNAQNLLDTIDIVLLSDHGMTNIDKYDEETYLDDDSYIIVVNTSIFPFDSNDFIIRDYSPIMGVYINESSDYYNHVDDAMNLMHQALSHNKQHATIYKNGEIPYITYNNMNEYNNRIPDFIVDSELHYSFYVENFSVPYLLGTHGYNNSEDDMQAIFMARGPSFKSGYSQQTCNNTDLYELFCHLLCDVTPSDNNGSIENVRNILRSESARSSMIWVTVIYVQALLVVLT